MDEVHIDFAALTGLLVCKAKLVQEAYCESASRTSLSIAAKYVDTTFFAQDQELVQYKNFSHLTSSLKVSSSDGLISSTGPGPYETGKVIFPFLSHRIGCTPDDCLYM